MTSFLPLTEVGGDEILARVTYQIILADYAINAEQYDRPADRLYELSLQWRISDILPIAEQLLSVAHYCAKGGKAREWLSTRIVIQTGRPSRLTRLSRKQSR